MLQDITTLDDYLTTYGTMLGREACQALRPLHVPSQHDCCNLDRLLRKPFEAQAHVVTASVKALRRQKSLMLVAEMGTGKTLMAMATVHAHAAGQPYRALVFCPGQLACKWARELRDTIPDADVQLLETWKDVVHLQVDRTKPKTDRPTWYVIARDRAKLGSKWRAAYSTKRTRNGLQIVCPVCYQLPINDKGLLISAEELSKKRYKCSNEHCRSPLWMMTGAINRFEPARFIHKKLKGFFHYLVLDEVHEEKSADTAQGHAAGSLAAACGKVIALTGTIIGGLADHIRPLLFRLSPATVVAEQLAWSETMRFSELYGRIETRITERSGGGGNDNRMSRGCTSRTKTKCVRPGIMPSLFGRHLMDKAVFLSLAEVAANLPELDEIVVPVEMDAELEPCYRVVEEDLKTAIKSMLRRGDKRLLGAMLQTLLAYPDHPYGWNSVGYYEGGEQGEARTFIPVTEPENLSPVTMRPKEEKLLELVQQEVGRGRQCWVYVQMTDKRDVAQRLCEMFQQSGLRSKVLRASVPLAQRESWIAKNAADADVIISHPKLVETGLDLFDKGGNHNFATLIFYEMGYNPFTLRQASRRSWRIGQTKRCKVFYLYYAGTMQERAMTLMGKKIAAAQALDGKFSSEGLAAMAGDDGGSMEMALAKSLAEQIDEGDARRAWAKVGQTSSDIPVHDDQQPVFADGESYGLFGQIQGLAQRFNWSSQVATPCLLAG